jgi:hypothetical protein
MQGHKRVTSILFPDSTAFRIVTWQQQVRGVHIFQMTTTDRIGPVYLLQLMITGMELFIEVLGQQAFQTKTNTFRLVFPLGKLFDPV